MNRTVRFLIVALFGVTVLGNACDNVKLSLVPKDKNITGLGINEICSSPPEVANVPIKVMFMVDMSGSNCTQYGLPPACDSSGTDPQKSYRSSLIQNFIESHLTQTNLSYGLVTFSGTTALGLINDGVTTDPIFTNDPSIVSAAITQFQNTADSGATPYKAALTMVNDAIVRDINLNAQKAIYYIVMISDGEPTDYGTIPVQSQINTDVQSLVTNAGKATFSTVYYNPLNNASDLGVLQSMAQVGGGGFLNTNVQGKSVPLEQIIAFSNAYPMVITQMMVTNLNSAPCDDGTMDTDSDADGICDRDEIKYNSTFPATATLNQRMGSGRFDPQNRNSFGASYNDLFYYHKIVYGQNLDVTCQLTGDLLQDDQDHDFLNTCEEAFIGTTTPTGPNSVWTSAMGNTADPLNFDSDGDGYLDWIEFSMGRSQSSVLDFNSATSLDQGYTMAQILNQHRNPQNPSLGTPYDGTLQFEKTNALGQNCYTWTQNTLPLYKTLPVTQKQVSGYPQLAHAANGNVIMIYFIQKSENAMSGPGELKYYFQTIDASVTDVTLNLDVSQYSTYTPTMSRVAAAISGGTVSQSSSAASAAAHH